MRSVDSSKSRAGSAEALVAGLFEDQGWDVDRQPGRGRKGPDLVVQKRGRCFVVEIKSSAEARADRVIPLLSQAMLQAQAYARESSNSQQALAVIAVENASQSLVKQVGSFVEEYAPDVSVGLVSPDGLRYFRGAGLDELNADLEQPRRYSRAPSNQHVNLFSDLNQWMLKVLLAPEIPAGLLRAPRAKYQSGIALAAAAGVSAMSASRFLQQLRSEGYLDESSRNLVLVRRAELLRRWRSAAMRPSPELPMRFHIRGANQDQVAGLVAKQEGEACLGLFAAADALRLGHVSGVPPYILVPKFPRPDDRKWRALAVAAPSEIPDVIVRQVLSPESIFRGTVQQDGLLVSDVIQVWLDVANHSSRGEEQANLIYEKVLRPIVDERS